MGQPTLYLPWALNQPHFQPLLRSSHYFENGGTGDGLGSPGYKRRRLHSVWGYHGVHRVAMNGQQVPHDQAYDGFRDERYSRENMLAIVLYVTC